MFRITISLASVVSLCLLVILLNITTPVSVGPFGLIAIFVLMYLLCLGLLANIIYYTSRLYTHLSALLITRRPVVAFSFKRSYYFSTILSSVPVILVGLQSVGRVGIYEYALVFIFGLIGCIYVLKGIK